MKRILLASLVLAMSLPAVAGDKPAQPAKAAKASTSANVPTGVDVPGCTFYKFIDGKYTCTDNLPYERDIERKPKDTE